jgi:hypothetical protein
VQAVFLCPEFSREYVQIEGGAEAEMQNAIEGTLRRLTEENSR